MEREIASNSRCIQSWKSSLAIEAVIAKAYIFLLPIRMISPFLFLQSWVGVCAIHFDLVLHLLGLFLITARNISHTRRGTQQPSALFRYFAWMIICFNFSSIVMACYMQLTYGSIGTDSAFSGISGMIVYFMQYLFMVYYNREVFRILSTNTITRLWEAAAVYLLMLGYLQIGVMTVGGAFISIHNSLDVFHVLYHASTMPKLCLTGSEGASAGVIIAVFVLPLLLSKILIESRAIKYIVQVMLWLPVIYFTKSSAAYIMVAAELIVFFLYLYGKRRRNKKQIFGLLLLTLLIFLILVFPGPFLNILPAEAREQVRYLLLNKVTDQDNGSTVARTVPLVVNWGAFTEYPVLGVGNGLQGYFYEKYFPDWATNVPGSDVGVFLERSKGGISNGGIFFPSLLSGYGILGILLVVGYILMSEKTTNASKDKLGLFYYIYKMARIAVLICGFQGDFYGNYFIWFVLSIPFASHIVKNEQLKIRSERR